jgi:hypothetical protein
MNPFPKTYILQDTGKRRYPENDEIYFWYDGMKVIGPCVLEKYELSNLDSWGPGPENFAIYKLIKEEE